MAKATDVLSELAKLGVLGQAVESAPARVQLEGSAQQVSHFKPDPEVAEALDSLEAQLEDLKGMLEGMLGWCEGAREQILELKSLLAPTKPLRTSRVGVIAPTSDDNAESSAVLDADADEDGADGASDVDGAEDAEALDAMDSEDDEVLDEDLELQRSDEDADTSEGVPEDDDAPASTRASVAVTVKPSREDLANLRSRFLAPDALIISTEARERGLRVSNVTSTQE